MDWTLIGGLVALASVAMLLGAALGYWAGAADMTRTTENTDERP